MNNCCNTCPSIVGGDCPDASNCIGVSLPTLLEILEVKRLFPEVSWGCHSNPKMICKGLIHVKPEALYSKHAGIIQPDHFATLGWTIAITHAKLSVQSSTTADEFVAVLELVTDKFRNSAYLRKKHPHI